MGHLSEDLSSKVQETRQVAVGDGGLGSGEASAKTDGWPEIEDLYSAERDGLLRLAVLLTDDEEVATELVHEAFLQLHRHWSSVDRPGGYVRTTLVNLCRGHHRRRLVADRNRAEFREEYLTAPFEGSEVWDALQRLPDRRRIVLTLRYYRDLPDAEIAEMLQVRPSTVRSLVRRGLRQLEGMLGDA